MLSEAAVTALVAGFSPWTLLIVAGLLSRRRHALRFALVFLGTAALVALLVGFLVVEALGGTGVENRQRHHSLSPAIDVALGVAILAVTPVMLRHPPRLPRALERRRRAHAERGRGDEGHGRQRREAAGLLAVVALGAFAGSPSPLYLAALHSVAKGRPGATAGVLEVVMVGALFLLMAEAPILLFALAPRRTTALLAAANAWLARNGRTIGVLAAGAVGCYFVITGIVHLL